MASRGSEWSVRATERRDRRGERQRASSVARWRKPLTAKGFLRLAEIGTAGAPTHAPLDAIERARGPRPRKRGAQCRGRRRFAVAAAGRTTAPTRDVVFIPSALAAAAVRSKDAPLANGPRSTTGTTSEWPAYQISTGVPQ